MTDGDAKKDVKQETSRTVTDGQIVTSNKFPRRSFLTATGALLAGAVAAASGLRASAQQDPDKKKTDPDTADKKKASDPDTADKKKATDPDKKKMSAKAKKATDPDKKKAAAKKKATDPDKKPTDPDGYRR